MPRRTDAEVGKLVRRALRGKRLRRRRLYDRTRPDGYHESDRDFVLNNFGAVVAILAALTGESETVDECAAMAAE